MSSLVVVVVGRDRRALLCCLLCCFCCVVAQQQQQQQQRPAVNATGNAPYEFSFNIVDFQHRYEKKDAEGLVTGEYGFITADVVYHETGYATDKKGDFIITRMRNRKITSLKDAQEIFKDRPEAAKKLVEAVARACSGCKILTKQEEDTTKPTAKVVAEPPPRKKMDPILKRMMKTLSETVTPTDREADGSPKKNRSKEEVVKSMVRTAKKLLSQEDGGPRGAHVSDRVLEKMANDLYYQFNYTITTHGHHENGYHSGSKDGGYRSQSESGVDTHVRYRSNEFGHQPNITFVPRGNAADEEHALKGYSFRWYWP